MISFLRCLPVRAAGTKICISTGNNLFLPTFFSRPVQKDRFLTEPARTEQVDRLSPHRRKTGPLGRPEPVFRLENKPAGVRTRDNRIATPVCRCFVRLHGSRPVETATDRAGIAGVNRPAAALPGRTRDPPHRRQAFFDTVFAQKIGGLFGILKFVRIFAHAFDTKAVTNDGAIAQLVEQRTENPCVPGSIPGGTTQNYSDLQQCKSLFQFTRHTIYTHRFFCIVRKYRRASGRKKPGACISVRMQDAKKQTFPARS